MFSLRGLTLISIAFFWALGNTVCIAQEYFSKFSGNPIGEFKLGPDGKNLFVLSKALKFLDPNGLPWEAPAGAIVDGASMPWVFWSIIGSPFTGAYFKASVIHGYYCDKRLRTAHDTHRKFLLRDAC
jgi:hypothetical protein